MSTIGFFLMFLIIFGYILLLAIESHSNSGSELSKEEHEKFIKEMK